MCQRRRKMERRSWEELPRDCLENVFQRLGLEDLSVGVPFVCKSWYEVSLNPIFWENIDLGDMNLVNSPFVERFKAEYHLQAFSFSVFLKFFISRGRRSTSKLVFPTRGVSLDDLVYVSEKCQALKILELPQSITIEEEKHIPSLIAKWKELESLYMAWIPSSFKEILIEINHHCGNFLGLKVRGFIWVEQVTCIVALLPKIKHLDLRLSFISNIILVKIIEGCRELKELDVRNCFGLVIDDEMLKRACFIEKFEHVCCIEKRPHGRASEVHQPMCPGLKFLELPPHFNNKEEEKHVPTLIARWKELQWLSMGEMRSSFKEVLTEINRHCGNFLGLKVTRGSIGEEEATCIAVLLPKIKHLDLSRCYISNNRLMKIMEGCRELKEVDVRSCIGLDINDEILKMTASLEKFEHEGCIKHMPRHCGLAGAAAMRRLEPGRPRFFRRAHES